MTAMRTVLLSVILSLIFTTLFCNNGISMMPTRAPDKIVVAAGSARKFDLPDKVDNSTVVDITKEEGEEEQEEEGGEEEQEGEEDNVAVPTAEKVDISNYLLGPDEYGTGGCPPDCGCPQSRTDCPFWYNLNALDESARIQDPELLAHHDKLLEDARSKALGSCTKLGLGAGVQKTGGWCLDAVKNATDYVIHPNGVKYPMSAFHIMPSTVVLKQMIDLFKRENTTSISEFGAGIGQYKAGITTALPHIEYHAYDGAGNGEDYTKGMLNYADFTLPLNLPVSDWVISYEVGEHIPNKFEGMFLRNLHRHNTKGIILSWAVLGQKGHSHINNHSNEYLIRIFTALGYEHDKELSEKFRKKKGNHWWFQKSLMVLRRKPQENSTKTR